MRFLLDPLYSLEVPSLLILGISLFLVILVQPLCKDGGWRGSLLRVRATASDRFWRNQWPTARAIHFCSAVFTGWRCQCCDPHGQVSVKPRAPMTPSKQARGATVGDCPVTVRFGYFSSHIRKEVYHLIRYQDDGTYCRWQRLSGCCNNPGDV